MRINTSLSNGLTKAFSLIKLVLVIYIFTFILSLLLGISFNLSMSSHKYNPMLSVLFSDFDYTVFSEFMNTYRILVSPFINSMIVFSFFYLLMEILFAGGIISKLFSPGRKIKTPKFFAGGARYFWRFTKLFLYKMLSLLIFFGIIITVVSVFFTAIAEGAVETDYVKIAVIAVLMFLIFFVIISAISDYAKIFIVGENLNSAWAAIKSAFRFVLKNFLTGVALYKIGLVIFIILTIIYLLLSDLIPVTNLFSLFVLFIVQQMFVVLRIFTKVFTLAAEYDFYSTILLKNKNNK